MSSLDNQHISLIGELSKKVDTGFIDNVVNKLFQNFEADYRDFTQHVLQVECDPFLTSFSLKVTGKLRFEIAMFSFGKKCYVSPINCWPNGFDSYPEVVLEKVSEEVFTKITVYLLEEGFKIQALENAIVFNYKV